MTFDVSFSLSPTPYSSTEYAVDQDLKSCVRLRVCPNLDRDLRLAIRLSLKQRKLLDHPGQ